MALMWPQPSQELWHYGMVERRKEPVVSVEKVCSDQTLQQLKECLEGVCTAGTAKNVFRNSFYKVAGKTGTALVANGSHGYAEHIYQSSFVGYFPADHPRYSCIVVIKNKPFAKKFLGASVAAPVFKEVADKLMSSQALETGSELIAEANTVRKKDSIQFYYAGNLADLKQVADQLRFGYRDSAKSSGWGRLYASNYQPVMQEKIINKKNMPDLKGMGLKDALFILEDMSLKVAFRGTGKVKAQSVLPGTGVNKLQTITLDLE